ncbi:MAG: hypothetical protein U0R78_05425 [Nocardioidaceae bacterium]
MAAPATRFYDVRECAATSGVVRRQHPRPRPGEQVVTSEQEHFSTALPIRK